MSDDSVTQLYKSIPKVELHLHLDGSCQLETLKTIARERNISIPQDDNAFRDLISFQQPADSLDTFLMKFYYVLNIIAGSSKALETVAYDFCKNSHEAGVVYTEVRFNPTYLMHSEVADDKVTLTNEQVMESVLSGLEKGQKQFGIKVNVIIAFITNMPDKAMELADLAIQYHDRGVVAVDIAGSELVEKSQSHIDAFKKAKDAGLHITVHAAESGPPEHVKEAIIDIGAERIGHGYRVLEDEHIYAMAKKKNIHFEMCPWSSIFTGCQKIDSHAMKKFHNDNMNFSINSDDPGIMGKTLVDDYVMAHNDIGLSYEAIKKSVFNGVDAAFLSDVDKGNLRERICKLFEEVEVKFNVSSRSV